MKHIVLIDDDKDVREVVQFALENEGFKVLSFENGKQCIDSIAEDTQLPGLIIVDYLMPEMDGVTFIQHVRTHFPESLSKVPIAMSSAMGSMSLEVNNLQDIIHLHKPMDLDDLLELVSLHCS